MQPTVAAIFLAPQAGAPMRRVAGAIALEGIGLEGDRYASGRGWWQTVENARKTVRPVTLITLNSIAQANAEYGTDFGPEETRRNIVLAGEIHPLDLLGREFRIGEVRLRGTGECAPCSRPSKLAGKSGFSRAFRKSLRGGVRAEVLSTGIIREGDRVELL